MTESEPLGELGATPGNWFIENGGADWTWISETAENILPVMKPVPVTGAEVSPVSQPKPNSQRCFRVGHGQSFEKSRVTEFDLTLIRPDECNVSGRGVCGCPGHNDLGAINPTASVTKRFTATMKSSKLTPLPDLLLAPTPSHA